MKNKILCFGLVLIFLTSMCGCNAEKADILESSDIHFDLRSEHLGNVYL